MSKSVQETSVSEIARELVKRREQGQRTILFLGSRTGGLFGNEYLHEMLKQFSLLNFDTLSNVDKFRECYYVLSKHFTEAKRHDILVEALAKLKHLDKLKCREEDGLLARLLTAGLFETIISTNIDTLLENACDSWNLKEPDDYMVITSAENVFMRSKQNKPKYSFIIKALGDLESRRYPTPGESFDLQKNGSHEFLQSNLGKDVLMIGYDPVWDQAIEQAFPLSDKTICYVNETKLTPEKSYLAQLLSRRESQFLVGDMGSYSNFIIELCRQESVYRLINMLSFSNNDHFIDNHTPHSGMIDTPTKKTARLDGGKSISSDKKVKMSENNYSKHEPSLSGRRNIFISYSHNDERYMKRLEVHLKTVLPSLDSQLSIWSDKLISPGADWEKEIRTALEHTKVAVLLVSTDFLASDFINGTELPILVESAQKGEVKLIPVLLSPCRYDLSKLSRYQVINTNAVPLTKMRGHRDELWDKVAQEIYNILKP